MRAADVTGPHAGWEGYFNGPADNEALQRIPGIGPARAALLLRVYGSIDQFLLAETGDVATRTRSFIGPTLARTLQTRCREAGLGSDWSRLEALAGLEVDGMPGGRGSAHAVLEWVERVRRRWTPLLSSLEPGSASR